MAAVEKSIFPMIFGAPVIGECETVFPLARELIRIQAPGVLIKDILEACDGQRTLGMVLELLESKWDRDTLEGFLRHLHEKGVLYDSSNLSGFVWPFVSNPSHFSKAVTDAQVAEMVERACLRQRNLPSNMFFTVKEYPFQRLVSNRKSERSFSGKVISMERVVQMLWAGYGVIAESQLGVGFDRHTVPSAGALYPLRLSLVLLQPMNENIGSGLYDVAFPADGSVGLSFVSGNLVPLYQSFANPLVLRNAVGVIVVSGAFSVGEEKYGNRSLLYVPLEAGHVAQNILLEATECGVATVEIGGFLEEPLREALQLPTEFVPLTTVVFGDSAGGGDHGHHLPCGFEVRWAYPKANGYALPFNLVFARLAKASGGSEEWSCGRSPDPFVAYEKATAEVREWAACSLSHNLVKSNIGSLASAVAPDSIVAFHPDQYASQNFPFFPFEQERVYEWKEATDVVTGESRFILADGVYFPYYPEYPRYASANSSGAAAYPTRVGAVQRGVLELIERDAFMIVWLNRLVMPTITDGSFPDDIRCRIRRLEEAGFEVIVKDATLDLAPVVLVFAQSEDLHYTTCSACCSFEIDKALNHALLEVEAAVYCRLAFGFSEPMLPEDVRMTQDHGKLYEQEAFFRQADFLKESRLLKDVSEVGEGACFHWEMLLARLAEQGRNVLAVDLENPHVDGTQSSLCIVKTFVTGLVPISFGYREEPCGMQRVYETPVVLGFRSVPIRYDELNRFPHPYT